MFSKCDRINFKAVLSQINGLITYVKNVKKYNIVLLDTPTHPNVGNAAIAIAEKNYLRKKLNIADIIEVTASNLEHMERIYVLFTNKNKLLLVHSGGFFR